MFDGFEVDVLSLGDADCILVSEWNGWSGTRLLIDGGKESDYPAVKAFLQSRNATTLDYVVCSHLHNDHAAGLIRLIADRSITVKSGWMHNIRNHVDAARLRRASASNSGGSDDVREVLENTDHLIATFGARGLVPLEPFAGVQPAILGPSRAYYRSVVAEFTRTSDERITKPQPAYGQLGLLAALSGVGPNAQPVTFPFAQVAGSNNLYNSLVSLAVRGSAAGGRLARSAVKDNPTTQPFNNTSVILGLRFKGRKFLFTADAGCDALRQVGADWSNLYCLQVPHHGSNGNLSKDLVERFQPQIAFISACGDQSHPSPSVKNALVTVGSLVYSTHYPEPGHLWFWLDSVPQRGGYGAAVPMKGTNGFGWPG